MSSSAPAARLSLHMSRRTQSDTGRHTLTPGTTASSTDLEEIQLTPVTTDRQSHWSHDKLSPRETRPGPPDDPQALSLNTSSDTRSPAHHDLLRALTYSSLVLENSGNIARDHLSIERTWLAYMRTSLLIAGTGVGIVQFFAMTLADNPSFEAEATRIFGLSSTLQRFARPLGEATVILALFLMLTGLQRYFKLQQAILKGMFPAAGTLVVLLSASLAIFVVMTCGVFLTLP